MTNPVWDSFEEAPLANFVFPTHTEGSQLGDEFSAPQVPELVLSTHRLTTAPIIVAANQGILPAGCVMGQRTSDGRFLVYAHGHSDGTQTAVGILRKYVDTSVGDTTCILVTGGVLNNTLVSGADSFAITSLNARVDNVTPTPRFVF